MARGNGVHIPFNTVPVSNSMPVSCSVIDCTNRFQKGSGIMFYRIPEREPKRTLWKNAIRRKNWEPSVHSRVCSRHFLSGEFKFELVVILFL